MSQYRAAVSRAARSGMRAPATFLRTRAGAPSQHVKAAGPSRARGAIFGGTMRNAPVSATRAPAAAHAAYRKYASAASADEPSVEDVYQKKTPIEHVLLRPDSYIGSTQSTTQKLWVFEEGKMVQRSVSYVPGLYKCFDEVLVNAADNLQRDPKGMTEIRVTIDKATGTISIRNNGKGVPVRLHKGEGVYVPEMIFGQLLTGSNFDDTILKVTGGRNGYGAKLCNIFSERFEVETVDHKANKLFRMSWAGNMGSKSEPVVEAAPAGGDYTCVTFKPDLAKFGMRELDDDIVALFTKRVYDVAGCNHSISVYLNDALIPIHTFTDYCDLYFPDKAGDAGVTSHVFEKANRRWQVCVAPSPQGEFQQVSFVNSINTIKGGTHVAYVTDQITRQLTEFIERKHKGIPVRQFQVKQHLWVFVNCLVENPSFDSQTKEFLTKKSNDFGSNCILSQSFHKRVRACGVVDNVVNWAVFKQETELKNSLSFKKVRISGIPKLDDANEAGGPNGHDCTLIVTEGDSAKALAVSGLSVVGRDHYGVFPVRGKLLNVREAKHKQIIDNAEVSQLIQILGLEHGKEYTDTKDLRYGKLMIMTDQDHDGSHIKGLIINMFHYFFPSLLKIPGFLQEFVTPIVKCTRGKKSVEFFTLSEYEQWKETHEGGKGWSHKYYKGLGTNTAKEAKAYFSAMQKHRLLFEWSGDDDARLIEMAFSKSKADERKEWLKAWQPNDFVDHNIKELTYSAFINKELVHFAMADNVRSIPSVLDGLKPSQRKILYACFKRNLKNEIKVAQLAGYVSEHAAYHHGEASLNSTIVNMAQDLVGSNNINLLDPRGQFGTRIEGGKDAASPRYIFTCLNNIARDIFPATDDALLTYIDEDGQRVEPQYYMPVIPMALANGSEGIGTGWSTSLPNFRPSDIIGNLRRMLDGEEPADMMPWYRGFRGRIEPAKKKPGAYTVHGVAQRVNSTTLDIVELPIGAWTQPYKEMLQKMIGARGKGVRAFREHHTDRTVHFSVTMTKAALDALEKRGAIESTFKLVGKISTTNMHLFDSSNTIKRYSSPLEILREFFDLRLDYYNKRKEFLERRLSEEYQRLDNRVRFVTAVVDGELNLGRTTRTKLESSLGELGLTPLTRVHRDPVAAAADAAAVAAGKAAPTKAQEVGFEYLLSMPLSSLTKDKVAALKKERNTKKRELKELQSKTGSDLWREDLDTLEARITALKIEEVEPLPKAVSTRRRKK